MRSTAIAISETRGMKKRKDMQTKERDTYAHILFVSAKPLFIFIFSFSLIRRVLPKYLLALRCERFCCERKKRKNNPLYNSSSFPPVPFSPPFSHFLLMSSRFMYILWDVQFFFFFLQLEPPKNAYKNIFISLFEYTFHLLNVCTFSVPVYGSCCSNDQRRVTKYNFAVRFSFLFSPLE